MGLDDSDHDNQQERDDFGEGKEAGIAFEYHEGDGYVGDPMEDLEYFQAPLQISYDRVLLEDVGDVGACELYSGRRAVSLQQDEIDPQQDVRAQRRGHEVLHVVLIVVLSSEEDHDETEEAAGRSEHDREEHQQLALGEADQEVEDRDLAEQDDDPPELDEDPPVPLLEGVVCGGDVAGEVEEDEVDELVGLQQEAGRDAEADQPPERPLLVVGNVEEDAHYGDQVAEAVGEHQRDDG